MKVYFTCSARGTGELGDNYVLISNMLRKMGLVHVYDYKSDSDPNTVYSYSHDQMVALYESAIENIKKSEVVVLEVSTHSLTMGFLMREALDLGKPVIALYIPKHEPVFALGIEDDKLQVVEYTPDSLRTILQESLNYALDQSDTRFNFFISPSIGNYLDWVSKEKRIPRAVYLRRLIEEDMKKNKDLA